VVFYITLLLDVYVTVSLINGLMGYSVGGLIGGSRDVLVLGWMDGRVGGWQGW